MNLPIQKNYQAFTLIELLIVVSLITILTGSVLPSFTRYLANQNTKNSVESMRSNLKTLQNRSLTSTKYDENVSNGTVTGPVRYWAVKFYSNKYVFYAIYDFFKVDPANTLDTQCTALPAVISAIDTRVQNVYSLPDGVTLSTTLVGKCLFFRMSDGAVLFSGDASAKTGDITFTNYTDQKVSWNYAGLIN